MLEGTIIADEVKIGDKFWVEGKEYPIEVVDVIKLENGRKIRIIFHNKTTQDFKADVIIGGLVIN